MAETNITSAGTGDWNAGATWTGGAVPDTDQHAIIQNGHNVTINANDEVKSLSIQGGGTLTGNSSYSITVNGEGNSSYGTNGYAVDFDGVIGANVNLIITSNSEVALDLAGSSGNVTNLTINHASCDAGLDTTTTISGDLTMTNGKFDTGNYNFSCANYAEAGSGTVETGSGTYTASGDWKGPNTKLIVDAGTFNITGKMGGAWDCNSKQVAINCASFHSTVSMTNGTSRLADNSAEDVIGTATSNAANAPVYGPLQGKWNFVTNSSGTKSFALREDFVLNGRMQITGSSTFTTQYSSVDYDMFVDGGTYHADLSDSGAYYCLEVLNSVALVTNSSNIILNQGLGSNLCDQGDFGSGTGSWVAYNTNTIANDSGALKITGDGSNANGAYVYLKNSTNLSADLTIGQVYEVTMDVKVGSSDDVRAYVYTGTMELHSGDVSSNQESFRKQSSETTDITNTSFETRKAYFVAGSSTSDAPYIIVYNFSSGEECWIDNITVKQVIPHMGEGHRKVYGYHFNTSVAPNFGTGKLITSGGKYSSDAVTKSSGMWIVNGAGDSTEYQSFSGSGAKTINLGSTHWVTTLNTAEYNTIGYNHTNCNVNITCHSHKFYSPNNTKWISQWMTTAPTNNVAHRTLTITGDWQQFGGIWYNGHNTGSRYGGGLTVTGDVTIYDGATINTSVDNSTTGSGMDVDISFGSLTINSGGTYNATAATTTINNENSSSMSLDNAGTYTHNKGTLAITSQQNSGIKTGSSKLYDLLINAVGANTIYIENDTEILNDFTITTGRVRAHNVAGSTNYAFTVRGNTLVTYHTLDLRDTNHTFDGVIAVGSSGILTLSTGTNNMNGGIRNLGGTIS